MIAGYAEEYEDLNQDIVLVWDLIPSEHYVEYEIGSNMTEYTAPFDGYVVVYCENIKYNNCSFSIWSKQNYITSLETENNGDRISLYLPIVKDSNFRVCYNNIPPTWIRIYKAKDFENK